MNKYIFNARDIAAYFKWFSVPNYMEVTYMQYIFGMGKDVLAVPLTTNFEHFKTEVYRELYFLWANGFVDDKSDISHMAIGDSIALICDQECINLESYMKLITLHLIFSRYLPYVKLNLMGLPLTLGIEADFDIFEKNVIKIFEALNLDVNDVFGKPFNLKLGVPDELLCISLNDSYKKSLKCDTDFRMLLRIREKERMEELRTESLKIQEENAPESGIKKISKKVARATNSILTTSVKRESKHQPKGAPVEGGGKPGKK